jgi:NAD(P)H-dependent flavin oxidoreductase YrpB (nitropropane dioxygenase family)
MKSFFIGDREINPPIIQGGMGVGISLSRLASAVANEGGIGVISCAAKGNMRKGYAFTGINAHLVQKISSVKEIIAILKMEFAMAEKGAI